MTTETTSQLLQTDQKTRAIVSAARKTFLAKGFDAASMDAIAHNANVSKRTVYNRFRSKEELFAASILEICNNLLPVNLEEIEQTLAPIELLKALSHKFVRGILEPDIIALRRIAVFEASRTPSIGYAYLQNGPRIMVQLSVKILDRLTARHNLNINDKEKAVYRLGALITEPLYTEVLLGQPPENIEDAISNQIDNGIKAFQKIYDL